jgi:hypothetical protein
MVLHLVGNKTRNKEANKMKIKSTTKKTVETVAIINPLANTYTPEVYQAVFTTENI